MLVALHRSLGFTTCIVSDLLKMATATARRPRNSCVWHFFKYLKEDDKSICLVNTDENSSSSCGHSLKGKFPTNLKAHLKKVHPSHYQELVKMESDKKAADLAKAHKKSNLIL